MVLPALPPVVELELYVQGAPVVVRPEAAMRRVQAQRRVALRLLVQQHVVAALRALWVLSVVGAVPRYRVVRICRVARVAAQWVPVGLLLQRERLAAQRLLAGLHAVAVLRVLQRVVHAAGCCHVARTCRVHQPDWCRMLSAVVAGLVGLRLASEPPL